MNETFILDKELTFKNNIYEIISLSIEHSYDVVRSNCKGEFILSGEYRQHEVSINKEDFSFRIPFEAELRSNINMDSIEVDINDFSYELNDNILEVHIEYLVRREQSLIEFEKEVDLDEFLQNNDAEVIDLSEEEIKEPEEEIDDEILDEKDKSEDEKIIEKFSQELLVLNEDRHLEEEPELEERIKITEEDKSTIINSINSEESFITYHVHTVIPSDTFESICALYNTNLNELKKYNNVDELILNMKLIIPDEEN